MRIWRLMLGILLLFGSLMIVRAGSNEPLPHSVRWSPNGRWIATNTTKGVWLYDLENPESEARVFFEGEDIGAIEFNPTGTSLAVSKGFNAEDNIVRIIDLETGAVTQEFEGMEVAGESPVIHNLFYSQYNRFLAIANGGTMSLYNSDSEALLAVVDLGSMINSITGMNHGRLVAATNQNSQLYIIDMIDGIQTSYYLVDIEIYEAEHYSGNSRFIINTNEGILIFNTQDESLEALVAIPPDSYRMSYSYSPARDLIIIGDVGIWQAFDMRTRQITLEVSVANEEGRVFAFDFNPDASQFVSLQDNGTITVWNTDTGEALYNLDKFEAGFPDSL